MSAIKILDYLLANEPNVFPNEPLMLAAGDFVEKYDTTGQLDNWERESAESILNLINRRRENNVDAAQ